MKKFPVMNHSRRHEIHFFPSWNFVPSVMILHNWSWVGLIKQPRVVLIHAPKLHTFTHPAWHQSPQAQHEGVQGFSLFIQSGLQAELLLVLRIVTPVSVARTGGGICRQIVQFRACKFTELFGAFLVSMRSNTWFHDHGLTMAMICFLCCEFAVLVMNSWRPERLDHSFFNFFLVYITKCMISWPWQWFVTNSRFWSWIHTLKWTSPVMKWLWSWPWNLVFASWNSWRGGWNCHRNTIPNF